MLMINRQLFHEFAKLESIVKSTPAESVLPLSSDAGFLALYSSLEHTMTVAPLCSVNSLAMARPISFVEQVTTATLLFSNKILLWYGAFDMLFVYVAPFHVMITY
jgi:hypothetical protein